MDIRMYTQLTSDSVSKRKKPMDHDPPQEKLNEVEPVPEKNNNGVLETKKPLKWYQFETKLRPMNIGLITLIHFLAITPFIFHNWRFDVLTLRLFFFQYFITYLTSLGVTGGVHRLWTHRAYTASTGWRIFVMLCFMGAGQTRIPQWVLDHRVHHKYSETNSDPHNAKRGFFFAHVGWIMMMKHPDIKAKGKLIDISDVLNDPVVVFSEKYYWLLKFVFGFFLPMAIPMVCWGERFTDVFMFRMLGWVLLLNGTWAVNSAAHLWGARPYDKRINPAENLFVSILAAGEGYHNFHHAFPWDYRAAESSFYIFNVTSMWIDLAAKYGLVSNCKVASTDLINRTILKYGDGSHPVSEQNFKIPPDVSQTNKNVKVIFPNRTTSMETEE